LNPLNFFLLFEQIEPFYKNKTFKSPDFQDKT
jgi:hypothetical protein